MLGVRVRCVFWGRVFGVRVSVHPSLPRSSTELLRAQWVETTLPGQRCALWLSFLFGFMGSLYISMYLGLGRLTFLPLGKVLLAINARKSIAAGPVFTC